MTSWTSNCSTWGAIDLEVVLVVPYITTCMSQLLTFQTSTSTVSMNVVSQSIIYLISCKHNKLPSRLKLIKQAPWISRIKTVHQLANFISIFSRLLLSSNRPCSKIKCPLRDIKAFRIMKTARFITLAKTWMAQEIIICWPRDRLTMLRTLNYQLLSMAGLSDLVIVTSKINFRAKLRSKLRMQKTRFLGTEYRLILMDRRQQNWTTSLNRCDSHSSNRLFSLWSLTSSIPRMT